MENFSWGNSHESSNGEEQNAKYIKISFYYLGFLISGSHNTRSNEFTFSKFYESLF